MASNDKKTGDEFSLESIIAEFGGSGPVKKPDDELDVPPEFTARPVRTAEPVPAGPAAEVTPISAIAAARTAPEAKPEPRPIPKPAPKPGPKAEPVSAPVPAAPAPSDEPVPAEEEPELFQNLRKSSVNSRPVPTAEELHVHGEDARENVVDQEAFDDAYRRRQHSIRNMRRQLKANDRAIKKLKAKKLKERGVDAVIPATLAAGSVPMPEGLKKSARRKPRLDPRRALRRLDKELRSLTVRSILCFVLCLPLIYMTASNYLKLPMPSFLAYQSNPVTYIIVELALLAGTILCAYDIYFGGCYSLITLKATGDSLIFASSLASIGHCIVSMLDHSSMYGAESADPVYAPICVLPALGLLVSMLGDRMRVRTYRSSLIKSHRLTQAYAVSPLRDKFDGDTVYASAVASDLDGFFDGFSENDAVASTMRWYAPLILVVSLLLAVYCSFFGGSRTPFFWSWSVIIGFTPALGFFLCASLPHKLMSKKLAKNGVITSGIRACARLGKRCFVLLRDGDLFPASAVSVKAVKPANAGDYPLCLTASILAEADTVLAEPFLAMARKKCIPLFRVRDFAISDAGGYSGTIDGHKILVGTCSFIQRSGIKTPESVTLRTALCCAADGKLLAIYAIHYDVTSSSDYAVSLLDKNGYFPILATRDVNLTSSMVQDRYGIPSAETVYPRAELRAALSASNNVLPSDGAISLQQTGTTLAYALVGCHRFRSAFRLSFLFSLISSLVGLALGSVMAFYGWYEAATPMNMLFYYLLWLIPVLLFSGWVNRY